MLNGVEIHIISVLIHFPEEAVEAGTMTMFKKHIGRHMNRKGLMGCGVNAGKLHWFIWSAWLIGQIVYCLLTRLCCITHKVMW